jgi:hypothetical protein
MWRTISGAAVICTAAHVAAHATAHVATAAHTAASVMSAAALSHFAELFSHLASF